MVIIILDHQNYTYLTVVLYTYASLQRFWDGTYRPMNKRPTVFTQRVLDQ